MIKMSFIVKSGSYYVRYKLKLANTKQFFL
jgi:hypothetical protein